MTLARSLSDGLKFLMKVLHPAGLPAKWAPKVGACIQLLSQVSRQAKLLRERGCGGGRQLSLSLPPPPSLALSLSCPGAPHRVPHRSFISARSSFRRCLSARRAFRMAFLLAEREREGGEGGKGGGREGGNLNKVHLNRVISLKQRESKRE